MLAWLTAPEDSWIDGRRPDGASIAAIHLHTEAVLAAWRTAGDRPVLAFAPGMSHQAGAVVHLDT